MNRLKEYWEDNKEDICFIAASTLFVWISFNLSIGWMFNFWINPLQAFGLCWLIASIKYIFGYGVDG